MSNNAFDIFSSCIPRYASRPYFHRSRNNRNEFNKSKKNEKPKKDKDRTVDVKVINDDGSSEDSLVKNIDYIEEAINEEKIVNNIQIINENKVITTIASINEEKIVNNIQTINENKVITTIASTNAIKPQNNSNLLSKTKTPTMIRTISEGIGLIASLGGHQGRKHDPPPGPEIIGKGLHVFNQLIKGMGIVIDVLATYDKNMPIGTVLEKLRLEGKKIEPLSG